MKKLNGLLYILELRRFKEVIISYDMFSPYVKHLHLKIWQEQYWKLVLSYNGEHGGKRKLRVIEEWIRARGINISQAQLLGEG